MCPNRAFSFTTVLMPIIGFECQVAVRRSPGGAKIRGPGSRATPLPQYVVFPPVRLAHIFAFSIDTLSSHRIRLAGEALSRSRKPSYCR